MLRLKKNAFSNPSDVFRCGGQVARVPRRLLRGVVLSVLCMHAGYAMAQGGLGASLVPSSPGRADSTRPAMPAATAGAPATPVVSPQTIVHNGHVGLQSPVVADVNMTSGLCENTARALEKNLGVPVGLLQSIARVETGRSGGVYKGRAWPWTLNVNGQGRYFSSKEEAVLNTRRVMMQGGESFDVGCMQVNLFYHPTAFRSIDDAFDPTRNITYAGRFLLRLHREFEGDWGKAVAAYHNRDPEKGRQYAGRVLRVWEKLQNASSQATADVFVFAPSAHELAARDYSAGSYAQAQQRYEDILHNNPDDPQALLGLALSMEQRGLAGVSQAYKNVVVLQPENAYARLWLLRRIRHMEPAYGLPELDWLLGVRPQDPEVLGLKAEFYTRLQQWDSALAYAVQAYTYDADAPVYAYNAAIIADKAGRRAQAVQLYRQFLKVQRRAADIALATRVPDVRQRLRYLTH
jgi:tetratricopeptide (TPR) repeat protein